MSIAPLGRPVRTLLVDNYDSFTYNLFHLIGAVNGVEPIVVANDAVDDPAALPLDAVDNIVISPGPGRPDVARDFGICRRLIDSTELPLLGVCLGHQGILLAAGGTVGTAPAARHGYPDRISHDGRDLFAGVPNDFLAVRYHSLCAGHPLPDALQLTATAADGVVMGVRHRYRPQWGVQFHPESVASAHGAAILRNFARLTVAQHTGNHRMPPRDSVSPLAGAARGQPDPPVGEANSADKDPSPDVADTPRRLTVLHEVIARAVDTEAIFLRLYQDSATAFWLDSTHPEPGRDRFSYLGDGSGPLAEVVRYRVGGTVRVDSVSGTRELPGGVLDYLSAQLRGRKIEFPDVPFDFVGGYVGYLGYEMKADCGAPGRHRSRTPDAQWLFTDRIVVVDRVAGRTHLLTLADPDSTATARDWLEQARAELAELPELEAPRPLELTTDEQAVARRLTRGRTRYLADIAEIRTALLAGETYEVNLTDSAYIDADCAGLPVYRALRRSNPAPYAAFLRFPGLEVACSSPERFLRVNRTRTVESRPIKGTAARGRTPDADDNLRRALELDPKTRAENLMIVDLLRNDLGRVCELGSVHVPELMVAETYSTLHQLVSTVRGRLRPESDVIDCLRACFPGGSMTGAPKLRTLELLDGWETEARGIYSGTLGFLGLGGTADLNIVIRTAVRYDGRWRVGAGGAVVLDSDPEAEYQEMVLKAAAALRAVTAVAAAHPPPAHS